MYGIILQLYFFSYGVNHPQFLNTRLSEALMHAFDDPDIFERKPMALYLHNDATGISHYFAESVGSQ